ncbi:MAG: hypothetical protein JWP59_3932 [Massilia sp.]|nr:hypothetical protein [Massilia sp.]
MTLFLLAIYALASVICFAMFAVDQQAAKAGRRRLSERSLLWAAAACGWPGGWLAQRWLRHKSGKASFIWRFRAAILLNILVLAAVILVDLYMSAYVALP